MGELLTMQALYDGVAVAVFALSMKVLTNLNV